jgi:argininosuccinate lyase
MAKLWDKGYSTEKIIEDFTAGIDRELDHELAEFDVIGSLAHIAMLESINLLTKEEYELLSQELKNIYKEIEEGDFIIEEGIEDIHSQVELMLTQRLGDIGKKIHSGRSRNDQVLVDLKLYTRNKLQEICDLISEIFTKLQNQSEKHKHILMPGYTHLQIAMPSSFGLWFGAYAESLSDDLWQLLAAYKTANQNPLGSAAGYGSSFPLDRAITTNLLGFDNLSYNSVYAQMGRGKLEKSVSFAISSIAGTIGKFAADVCLYMCQNFNFLKLPDSYTTGSSIMPHKKNPDVFELLRARCNKLQMLPAQISAITNSLTSGYFRDLQVLKEIYIPAFKELTDCLNIVNNVIEKIEINENIVTDSKYKYIFSVEEVNNLVLEGMPFRDAYKHIASEIENGNFEPEISVNHTHMGSIGNLCNQEIKEKFNHTLSLFEFDKSDMAVRTLVE